MPVKKDKRGRYHIEICDLGRRVHRRCPQGTTKNEADQLELKIPTFRRSMKTLDTVEAAHFLRLHPDTLLARAKAGEIPGCKPGKCWVFIDDDLAAWLRSQYSGHKETPEKPLHSPNEKAVSGGSMSPNKVAAEYAALLARKTVKPPRNTTTVSRPNFGGKRS